MAKLSISCWRLRNLKGFPGCCETCHEDADEYGYDLSYPFFNRPREYEVCCKVSTWLKAAFPDAGRSSTLAKR